MALAVEEIRRMRGGAQSHLMRCADDSYYVVKFQNNPQGVRILVNELLGTRLAARLGFNSESGSASSQEFVGRKVGCGEDSIVVKIGGCGGQRVGLGADCISYPGECDAVVPAKILERVRGFLEHLRATESAEL